MFLPPMVAGLKEGFFVSLRSTEVTAAQQRSPTKRSRDPLYFM